jgi:hypothetical protein
VLRTRPEWVHRHKRAGRTCDVDALAQLDRDLLAGRIDLTGTMWIFPPTAYLDAASSRVQESVRSPRSAARCRDPRRTIAGERRVCVSRMQSDV